MITNTTLSRILWHAGLHERETGEHQSVASATWPKGQVLAGFQEAVADCLMVLNTLNQELNPNPEEYAPPDAIPSKLAYAISEITRMIRECQEEARDEGDEAVFARAAWRVETAWSAVLAGDIGDLLKHIEDEEAMKFG